MSTYVKQGVAILLALALVVGLGVAGASGCKSYNRYQKRADANNEVTVQNTLNKVTLAHAENLRIEAGGIRDSQNKIQDGLTPLYIQWKAVEAQLAMAKSQNHTIIYVPAGTNGTPIITENGRNDPTTGGK